MERELLARIEELERMDDREFLYKVIMQLELEFPGHSVRIIETLNDLISVRFGSYSVLITQDEIDMLKDVEDPYALDRYLLAHFLRDGMIVDPEGSSYLRHIFGMYYDRQNEFDTEDY